MKTFNFFLSFLIFNLGFAFEQLPKRQFLTDEEIKLSGEPRAKTVLKCAGCHQNQYKDWLTGPHANAYKMWLYHFDNVKKERPFGYFTAEQSRSQIETFKDKCLNCHNPPNLMETAYDKFKENKGHMTGKEIYDFWDGQKGLRLEKSSVTSIDCLTCHVRNDQVLTSGKISAYKDYGGIVHVKGDRHLGKAENNCIACHEESVTFNFPYNVKDGQNSCLNCHAEQKDGKYTHNIFWRHGLGENTHSSKNLYGTFDLVSVKKISNDEAQLSWLLAATPHKLAICSGVVLVIEGLDSSKNIRWTKTIKGSRQDEFIRLYQWDPKKFAKDFPEQYYESYSAGPEGGNAQITIPIGKYKIQSIQVKGYFQLHFWKDFSQNKPAYEKLFKL